MSSPFAQKFFGKKPFTSTPKKQEKDYEAIGKKAVELEKKYSADRGDAPDYEARLMVQKELAKKESPLKGAYASGAGSASEKTIAEVPVISQAFSNLQGQIMQGFKDLEAKKQAKKKKKNWSDAFKSFSYDEEIDLNIDQDNQNPFYKG